jgi:CBS domain-containing protein
MRREVVTVSGATPLDDLERVMESEGAGRLPVVSDEGKLLGLVTRTDVLRERKLYSRVGASRTRRVR